MTLVDSFEKIPVKIYPDLKDGSSFVAREIADLIRSRQAAGTSCILGMATGSTPRSLYRELVRMHKEEGLSFRNVITFNLDEYYPIEKDAYQSYWSFMHRHLFDHVDIDPANIHIPNGELPKEAIKAHCQEYDQMIEDAGAGFAIEPENAAALVQAIEQLTANPALGSALGQKGRNYIVENFSRRQTAEKYIRVLETLVPPRTG